MSDTAQNRHVLDIPPVYLALTIVLMVVLHRALPIAQLIGPPLSWLGWVSIAAGIGIAVWAERLFARAGTGVRPFTPSTELVIAGPYRFTRNPMYLGMMLVLTGGFLLAGSLGSLLPIPFFFWLIRQRFVLPEEEHMIRHFGDDYRQYRKEVRRWL